jgi:hypothetical protein
VVVWAATTHGWYGGMLYGSSSSMGIATSSGVAGRGGRDNWRINTCLYLQVNARSDESVSGGGGGGGGTWCERVSKESDCDSCRIKAYNVRREARVERE